MIYYKYVDFSGETLLYCTPAVPEDAIYKYYKTMPCKVIQSVISDSIENEVYNLSVDRLIIISDKKIINKLNKFMVFQ